MDDHLRTDVASSAAEGERNRREKIWFVVCFVNSHIKEKGRTMATAKQASHITIEDLTLSIAEEIHVRASIDKTFEALLEQLGPRNEVPEKGPMPMKLEAWPRGRWFRDLGGEDGHFWAHVQAIQRPSLSECAA